MKVDTITKQIVQGLKIEFNIEELDTFQKILDAADNRMQFSESAWYYKEGIQMIRTFKNIILDSRINK